MTDESPLSPFASSMLDAERSRPDVSSAVEDRIFARLAESIPGLGGGGGGGGGGAGSGGAGLSALGASKVGPIAIAFVIGVGVGALGAMKLATGGMTAEPSVVTTATATVLATATASAEAPATAAATASASAPATASASAPATASTSAPATASAPATGRDDALARERMTIERARMAIARGSAADALAALDEHAREFPAGRMAEEREALAVHALATQGRADEARVRALRFRTRYPKSVFLPVVDRAAPRLEP